MVIGFGSQLNSKDFKNGICCYTLVAFKNSAEDKGTVYGRQRLDENITHSWL